jgi:hypothetical protein
MQSPGPKHFSYLKRVLRYLKGHRTRCLVYDFTKPAPRAGLYGLYDAAHADDHDTRRSTMAYILLYEANNSEYCASAKAARKAKHLDNIFALLALMRLSRQLTFLETDKAPSQ